MRDDQQATLHMFDRNSAEARELFITRNAEYDSAFKKYGVLGVVFELLGVLSRLPNMTVWQSDHGKSKKEKLRDIFMDIHNFATMAMICMDEDNWDGR